MAYKNNFFLVGLGTPNIRTFFTEQKKQLADVFCGSNTRMIFTRHLYFTNFTEHGCAVKYFNIVRDDDKNDLNLNPTLLTDERACIQIHLKIHLVQGSLSEAEIHSLFWITVRLSN